MNLTYGPANESAGGDPRDFELRLEHESFRPEPRVFENANHKLVVLGRPILGDRIDPEGVFELVTSQNGQVDWERLNGEFLLIHVNRETGLLRIVNDRFASIPLYYAMADEGLAASIFYSDLSRTLRDQGRLRHVETAFFEFLWLNRILGTKTYDTESRYLSASSCLTFDGERIAVEPYWSPSFDKTSVSVDDSAYDLARLLRQSARRKTSDDPGRVGLFLSGGMDSRTVLGSFDDHPVCFTVGVAVNNEVKVGREVAEAAGSEHVYIQIAEDPYSDRLDEMVQIGGGMSTFENALFLGYRDRVEPYADVLFHGHGLDYMFQGMYVPANRVVVAGRPTFFSELRPIDDDFVADFLSNVPYRMKQVNVLDYVKPAYRADMKDSLWASVGEIVDEGKKLSEDPYDLWEYMLVHALSRHYSNPNLSSIATCGEQRTITFDNDIFDFYLSLPVRHRLGGKIARATLHRIAPELARIRTGNTNIQAGWSPARKQSYWVWDALLRKARVRSRSAFYAPPEERTWPDRGKMYQQHAPLRRLALEMAESEALDSLNFLDMDAIRTSVNHWIENPDKFGGAFMSGLITLDRFLKQ